MAWVLNNCRIDPDLREAIEELLDEQHQPAPRDYLPANFSATLRKVHREMVLKYHPDRGGSHEEMVAITAFHERLQELIA